VVVVKRGSEGGKVGVRGERAEDDPLGEPLGEGGVGVDPLDRSRGIDSKGLVFT
jgi:hypothetical protein